MTEQELKEFRYYQRIQEEAQYRAEMAEQKKGFFNAILYWILSWFRHWHK